METYSVVETVRQRKERYLTALDNRNIDNYTEFFSQNRLWARIERKNRKISDTLKTGKIMLGAINPYSGNTFVRGLLDGHPDILLMAYGFWDRNLFFFCNQLSRENAKDILPLFWKLFKSSFGEESVESEFCDPERFQEKMKELLQEKERFSSQELFIIFHIAYAAMWGKAITNLEKTVIYWEPHNVDREDLKYYARWLENGGIEVCLFRMVRNQCTRAGAYVRDAIRIWEELGKGDNLGYSLLLGGLSYPNKDYDVPTAENELLIRFEDMKCEPRKELSALCERLGIPWSESLMKTTRNGIPEEFCGVRDFDLKPVYNWYEEYFSWHDKIRISILASPWQKRYGYAYEHISDYSRRELQELFLKRPRFIKADVYHSMEQELRARLKVQRWERDYLQRAWRMEVLSEIPD